VIYFIIDTVAQAIKIGYSAKPLKRLGQLQTASPHRLALLGTIPGTPDDEDAMHGRFAAHRMEGEWFRGEIVEDVLGIIAAHKDFTMTAEAPAEDAGIKGVCSVPSLRMTSFTYTLTERPEEGRSALKGSIICGVEIKYVVEFDAEVTGGELPKLQHSFVTGTASPRARHLFLDAENAVIPFSVDSLGSVLVVGGQSGITGIVGQAFRVLIVAEKSLRPAPDGQRFKDIFTGDIYPGCHPLQHARRFVVLL